MFRFCMRFGNPVGLPVLFRLGDVVFGARKRLKPGQCAAGDGYRLVSKCPRFSDLFVPSISSESETRSNRWRRSCRRSRWEFPLMGVIKPSAAYH